MKKAGNLVVRGDLKLDGVWVQAKVGDLVRLPRGIPHGYFNKSNEPARAFFWVTDFAAVRACPFLLRSQPRFRRRR